jgi:hypothetical protein
MKLSSFVLVHFPSTVSFEARYSSKGIISKSYSYQIFLHSQFLYRTSARITTLSEWHTLLFFFPTILAAQKLKDTSSGS